MKKNIMIPCLCTVVIMSAALAAYAKPYMSSGQDLQKIKLSDSEKAKLEALAREYTKNKQELDFQIEDKNYELKKLYRADSLDQTKILNTLEELKELKVKMYSNKENFRLEILKQAPSLLEYRAMVFGHNFDSDFDQDDFDYYQPYHSNYEHKMEKQHHNYKPKAIGN